MSDKSSNIKLFNDWLDILKEEFTKEYIQKIKIFLQDQKKQKKVIFPKGNEIFQALNYTSFENTKVVILGQDPYHGEGQAHGLAFSVKKDCNIPPSLKNIYIELKEDLKISIPEHGCLENWAKQGVLLLNTVLTVEKSKAASHANLLGKGEGWETFTRQIIKILNNRKSHLVFILWGAYAKFYQQYLDLDKHMVISSSHPSPFSAHYGFFGSKPFSKTNNYLKDKNIDVINWVIQ